MEFTYLWTKMDSMAAPAGPARVHESVSVVGLGLPTEYRPCLLAAFPNAILYTPVFETRANTTSLCDVLGKVVIFTFIPCMLPHMWVRTSAVYPRESVRVIGLHPQCEDSIYDLALGVEFDGVLDAASDPAGYRRAAESVWRGELWFPRDYLSRRTRESVAKVSPVGLSQREAEVLALLAGGATNQMIADTLCLTRDTVRWHLRSIYTKIGVSDRAAASRLARNTLAQSPAEPEPARSPASSVLS